MQINYDEDLGLHEFENLDDAKTVFVEGKRMAKGTTQEVGLSTTYFANPFGPMQQQDICDPIIDKVYECLRITAYLSERYTLTSVEIQRIERASLKVQRSF